MKALSTVVLVASLCLCGYGDVAAQSGVTEDTKKAAKAVKKVFTGGA